MMVRQAHHTMKNKRGFTLLEMVIVIGISALLLTGMTRAAHTLMKSSVDNRNYLIALNLAKQHMALMNNEVTVPAVVAETAQAADANFPSFIPTREVVSIATNVDIAGTTDYIRQITVRIRLNSVTGPVLMRLDTYRSNIITFGNGT